MSTQYAKVEELLQQAFEEYKRVDPEGDGFTFTDFVRDNYAPKADLTLERRST